MKKTRLICVLLAVIIVGCSEKKQVREDVSLKLPPEKVEWFKDA